MAEDVPPDWLRWVAEVRVRIRRDLVRHDNGGVVEVTDLIEVVQVFVELLLSVRELATADVLGAEVSGQRVDREQANWILAFFVLACQFLCLLGEQHLVVGVERLRDVDLVEDVVDEFVDGGFVSR